MKMWDKDKSAIDNLTNLSKIAGFIGGIFIALGSFAKWMWADDIDKIGRAIEFETHVNEVESESKLRDAYLADSILDVDAALKDLIVRFEGFEASRKATFALTLRSDSVLLPDGRHRIWYMHEDGELYRAYQKQPDSTGFNPYYFTDHNGVERFCY